MADSAIGETSATVGDELLAVVTALLASLSSTLLTSGAFLLNAVLSSSVFIKLVARLLTPNMVPPATVPNSRAAALIPTILLKADPFL